MPIKTMDAYSTTAAPRRPDARVDEARRDIAALADFGIDYST
jgi:hypothetical protein